MSQIHWLAIDNTMYLNSLETSRSRPMTGIKMSGILSFGVRMTLRRSSSGVFEGG
jgi:hypothetical protein